MITDQSLVRFLLSVGTDETAPSIIKDDVFKRLRDWIESEGECDSQYVRNQISYYLRVKELYLERYSEDMRKLLSREKSQKQEARVAQELNGKVVIASGALWGSKGDVRNSTFLVECKITSQDYYRLEFSIWNKIRKEATRDGIRVPVMCIDLLDGIERFAVFETGVVPIPADEAPPSRVVYTSSFMVKEPITISFEKYRTTTVPISVTCIPWEDFLKYTEDWV